MPPDKVDFARLDENVKHIRQSVDKLLEKQGDLQRRVQSNESDIETLDDDVKELDNHVGQINTRVLWGAISTIFVVLLTAGLSHWLGL